MAVATTTAPCSHKEQTCERVPLYWTMMLGTALATLGERERGMGNLEEEDSTSLKEKLIKIGAKIVSHGRYVAFQMAEVAIPKNLFADILRMIADLRPPPNPAPA